MWKRELKWEFWTEHKILYFFWKINIFKSPKMSKFLKHMLCEWKQSFAKSKQYWRGRHKHTSQCSKTSMLCNASQMKIYSKAVRHTESRKNNHANEASKEKLWKCVYCKQIIFHGKKTLFYYYYFHHVITDFVKDRDIHHIENIHYIWGKQKLYTKKKDLYENKRKNFFMVPSVALRQFDGKDKEFQNHFIR